MFTLSLDQLRADTTGYYFYAKSGRRTENVRVSHEDAIFFFNCPFPQKQSMGPGMCSKATLPNTVDW